MQKALKADVIRVIREYQSMIRSEYEGCGRILDGKTWEEVCRDLDSLIAELEAD